MRFDAHPERLQNDLLWAASSADMMQFGDIPSAQGLRSVSASPANGQLQLWLQTEDHTSALLALIKARQPRRLGIYFEVLWQYILEYYPDFELIHRNLPVISGKQTLGEMDFIYYCHIRKRHIHLETAVKFYLGLPAKEAETQPQWRNWLGPGCVDRLDIKLAKMLGKQTRLSATAAGSSTLRQTGIDNPLREICLKGYFFYPLSNNCPPPPQSHAQHARGYWLRQKQLPQLPPHSTWYVMKKEEWLSPVTGPHEASVLTARELESGIKQQLATRPFPMMIARMSQSYQGLVEHQRYFVTPDNWPQSEAAS
ncbi:MAG: DUF1853 family protein [Pseudomonadales bacterium]